MMPRRADVVGDDMHRMFVLAAAAALAGCGRSEGGAAPGAGAPAPAGMPAWAAPMNGAKLETALAMRTGGVLTYHVVATNEAVLAYYDARTAAAGLRRIVRSPDDAHGGAGAIYSSDPPGGDVSKRLAVSVGPEGGRTRVDVTYKPGG